MRACRWSPVPHTQWRHYLTDMQRLGRQPAPCPDPTDSPRVIGIAWADPLAAMCVDCWPIYQQPAERLGILLLDAEEYVVPCDWCGQHLAADLPPDPSSI